ncbi:hypothetical protein D3C81_1209820 [compost metagenome]
MAGDEQQRGQANRTDQLHHSRGNTAGSLHLHRQAQVVVGQAGIAFHLARLRPVDLHFLLAGQRLVGGLKQLRTAFLDPVTDAAVALGDLVHHPCQWRGEDEDGQRHLPAVVEHHRQRPQRLQRLLQHHLHRIDGGLRHLVTVRTQPHQHRRNRFVVEALPRQAQVFAQHAHAQVTGNAARGLAHADIGQVTGNATHQEQANDGQRHPWIDVFRVHQVVGDRAHQRQETHAGSRLDQHAQQRHQQQHPVRLGKRQKPLVGLPGGFRCATHDFASGAVAMAIRRKPS